MNKNQFSLKQLLGATAVVAIACALLAKMAETEVLRGPLLFLTDPAPENTLFGLVAVLVLVIGMLSSFGNPVMIPFHLFRLPGNLGRPLMHHPRCERDGRANRPE